MAVYYSRDFVPISPYVIGLRKSALSHSVYRKDIMVDTFGKVRRKIMQRQHAC